MGGIGVPELLIVMAVLLLFFGAKRLPEMFRSMGQATTEFKKGMKEGDAPKTVPVEGPCPFCATEVQKDSKFCPGCGKSADEIVTARAKETASKTA
jgi:sec-independent protein translocase protein TatA